MAKNLKQHIRQYYRERHLDSAVMSELRGQAGTANDDREAGVRPSRRLRVLAGTCAAAAVLLLSVIPLAYRAGETAARLRLESERANRGEVRATQNHNRVVPTLVAVRFHADWCARSPEIAPVFDRVRREYGMAPILLVTLDLTDDVRRHQSEQLAEAIGVRWILDEGIHTGTVALVDREAKETLIVVSDPADWPTLADAVGRRLTE